MTDLAKAVFGRTLGWAVFAVALGAIGCAASVFDEGLVTPQNCVATSLPLQNARSFALGDTAYLPRLSGAGCPSAAAWEVSSAPPDSRNRVYMKGAPEPRFTADRPGTYRFHVPSVPAATFELHVTDRG